jgi:hypothetical protein
MLVGEWVSQVYAYPGPTDILVQRLIITSWDPTNLELQFRLIGSDGSDLLVSPSSYDPYPGATQSFNNFYLSTHNPPVPPAVVGGLDAVYSGKLTSDLPFPSIAGTFDKEGIGQYNWFAHKFIPIKLPPPPPLGQVAAE